jgi:hypothetical protein
MTSVVVKDAEQIQSRLLQQFVTQMRSLINQKVVASLYTLKLLPTLFNRQLPIVCSFAPTEFVCTGIGRSLRPGARRSKRSF